MHFRICSGRRLDYLLADCLLRQVPGRWFGDRFSEHPPRFKVCPNGHMSLCQGFLIVRPPGRTILKVGYTGDEAAVFLTPEYLYCVPVFWLPNHTTSFPEQSLVNCSCLPALINIRKS